MTDELKKVQLTEEESDLISGGSLMIENNSVDGRLLWSSEDDSVMYTFGPESTRRSLLEYLMKIKVFGKSDAEQISALESAGLIWPL